MNAPKSVFYILIATASPPFPVAVICKSRHCNHPIACCKLTSWHSFLLPYLVFDPNNFSATFDSVKSSKAVFCAIQEMCYRYSDSCWCQHGANWVLKLSAQIMWFDGTVCFKCYQTRLRWYQRQHLKTSQKRHLVSTAAFINRFWRRVSVSL